MVEWRPPVGFEDDREVGQSGTPQRDERLSEALRQKEWLGELTRCKGWSILEAFVADQCQRRMNEVMLNPAANTPEVAAQLNFTRGEYAGLQIVLVHVRDLKEAAQSTIDLFKQGNLDNA
jgi:hypothetical protein